MIEKEKWMDSARSASSSSNSRSSRSASCSSNSSSSSNASSSSPASYPRVLKPQNSCENLHFFHKTEVLYQMVFFFTGRFLQKGDRTIDQMVQAARSGKQNIVEGSADGVTSSEMEIRLMNVARASIRELKEDFADYLATRRLTRWTADHPRYDAMLAFCRTHNKVEDYEPFFPKWSAEELCNTGLTLCHMVDKMMTTYIGWLEKKFVTEGGIKERMTAARLGYRTEQRERISRLEAENASLQAELARLSAKVEKGSLSSSASNSSSSSNSSNASISSNSSNSSYSSNSSPASHNNP